MAFGIANDLEMFQRKLRKLKEEGLERFFNGETWEIAQPNGRVLKIPIRQIAIPHFCHASPEDLASGNGRGGDGRNGQGRGQGSGSAG